MIDGCKRASMAVFLGGFFCPFGILFAALIRGDYIRCAFCRDGHWGEGLAAARYEAIKSKPRLTP